MISPSIYSYIKGEESRYETDEVRVGENWNWNMKNHVQMLFHLKNGVFFTSENDWMRSFKNIMEPMLNLSYWTEDIEVKDVDFYTENERARVYSFLLKKYHNEVYVREHDLDTLFDEITESDLDFGGVVVQKGSKRPELVSLVKIAFCDQSDILGAPIGVKYSFSPSALRKMKKAGWGNTKNGATIDLEDLIMLASYEKEPAGMSDTKKNQSTGKIIEVYLVRGDLPEHYLKDNDNMDEWYYQVHVVAFYENKDGNKEGVTLFRIKGNEDDLMFHSCKPIENRALGRGVGESLLHPQIWTNFLSIHKTKMLEAAAKVPLYTDDPNLTNRNVVQDMDNLELLTLADGKRIYQTPTASPVNQQMFDAEEQSWLSQAQLAAAAFDPILGKEQNSGTTFRGQERTVAQGRGLHDRRRGQRAKFIENIYRKWIIPDMKKELLRGKKFLASLTADEITWVSDEMAENYADKQIIEDLFNLRIPQDKEVYKQEFKQKFVKNGDKFMIEIMEGEMEDIEIKIGINIANKQKDLVGLSDKILSVFQFALANPVPPHLQKSFNDILEYGGLSPADFSNVLKASQTAPQPQVGISNQIPQLNLNTSQSNV